MKERFIISICFLLLLIYSFLLFKPSFYGPDRPIYYAYTESIVEDGDLNIVNNIHCNLFYYFPSGIKGVSKSFNYPDFHGHGGIVFWAPFYSLGKFLYSITVSLNLPMASQYTSQDFIQCLMAFSTIIFGFLTLLLTYILCNIFFSKINSLISTIVIFLGTPFFYYMLFEPGNAQILTSAFSVTSILFIGFVIRDKKIDWFLYGLFFGMCLVIKADIWAQIFFIILFFVILLKSKQTRWINGITFILGFFPICILKAINDYLKYGTFHLGEIGVLNPKLSFLFDMLFSDYRGYVYTSPILYVCFASIILVALSVFTIIIQKNNISENKNIAWRDTFILALSLYLLIKILIISRVYAWGGGTAGCRALFSEFPVFVILYARMLCFKNKSFKIFLLLTSLILIAWNMLVISEYIMGFDLAHIGRMPGVSSRIRHFNVMFTKFKTIQGLTLKIYLCLVPLMLLAAINYYLIIAANETDSSFLHLREKFNKNGFRMLYILVIYLNISYTLVTIMNLINNSKNVDTLKKNNFFVNSKILDAKDFEKIENVGSMKAMINYYTLKGNIKKADKIKEFIKKLYGRSNI